MNTRSYRQAEKITVFCIIGNILLSAGKLFAGIFGKSEAMVADALHSASDIIATSVVLIGIKVSKKPVDSSHPYGHGKVEPICAAFVGIALVIAGFLIIYGIIETMILQTFAAPTPLALGAAIVSIAVKETMYRVTCAAGKRIGSQAMMADAWHHRSDALSSVGTFLGILGSMAGNWLGIGFLGYLDPLAGVVVACLIFKVAYEVIRRAVKELMDAAPDSVKIESIQQSANNIDGVLNVPWVKARYMGRHLLVDIEIEVSLDLSVVAGHDIAERVRQCIKNDVCDVSEVLVHIEPVGYEQCTGH